MASFLNVLPSTAGVEALSFESQKTRNDEMGRIVVAENEKASKNIPKMALSTVLKHFGSIFGHKWSKR